MTNRPGFPWIPTPTQVLLLRAILLHDDAAARRAYDQWRSCTTFDSLDGGTARLLPLLFLTAKSRGWHDPETALLHARYRAAWAANTMLFRSTAPYLVMLANVGIELVLLKGAGLIDAAYGGNVGARPATDVDILVRPADAPKALAVLQAQGFNTTVKLAFGPSKYAAYGAMNLGRGTDAQIDLHWRLHNNARDHRQIERMWTRRREVSFAGGPASTLDPTDHLLHAVLHGAASAAVSPCRWVADAVLLTRCSTPINWGRLLLDAAALGAVRPMQIALPLLVREFDAGIPAEVLERLERLRADTLDRVQHWVRTGPPTRIRESIHVATDYLARTDGTTALARAVHFPRYLRNTLNRGDYRMIRVLLGIAWRGPSARP